MKHFTLTSLLIFSLSLTSTAKAEICPTASGTDHYVTTKLRAEKQGDAAGTIRVYYQLLNAFDPQKPTLLVINGGPGGDHGLIDYFKETELSNSMNIVGFDHRGLGCTYPLSPWDPFYEKDIFSMSRASDDIEAIRKNLLGEQGKWFVYGLSYGTFLSQQYAIKYPRFIRGIILDSAFHDTKAIDIARQQYIPLFIRNNKTTSDLFDQFTQKYPDLQPNVLRSIRSFTYSYGGRTEYIPWLLQQLVAANSREDVEKTLALYPDVDAPLAGMSRHILCEEIWDYSDNQEANRYYLTAMSDDCGGFKNSRKPMSFADDLKKLSIRTFIWGGKFDPVTPLQTMREMHELIPHSLLWEHPHAGHGLIRESSTCAFKLASMFFNGRSDDEIMSVANSAACQQQPLTTFAQTQAFLRMTTFPGMKGPIL